MNDATGALPLDLAVRALAAHVTGLDADSTDLGVTRMQGKDAWRLDGGSEALLLKRYRPFQSVEDVRWEHAFLTALADAEIQAPIPWPAFGGESWLQLDGRTWGALTFVPGRSLAWGREPGIDAAGELLAEYHAAVRGLLVSRQRPTATPLRELRSLLEPRALRVSLPDDASAREFSDMLATLERELDDIAFDHCERLVVHGDATTDNMVIYGRPPRLTGLIDFGSAHVERRPADLGAALWRSGRAQWDDIGLDPQRVATFVRGYHRRAPLTESLAQAVPTLVMARGLQLFVRRVQQATDEQLLARRPLLVQTLQRTIWVRDHQCELESAIDAALYR